MKEFSRKLISLLLVVSLLIGFPPTGGIAASNTNMLPFTDVKTSDWFYEPVQYVNEQGLMTGTGTNLFSPQLATTRGMIVSILHRMEGSPAASSSAFIDVTAGQWYSDAVNWAASNGIVGGFEDGSFRPDDPITREQMASIMYRYSDHKGYDVTDTASLSKYTDSDQVSEYAKDVMKWAVGSGLLSGRGDNLLAPQGQTTRAEAATILMRYCKDLVLESGEMITITFDSNGGSNVPSQTVNKGGKVKEPNEPTREGYDFVGWKIENSSDFFDFSSMNVFNNLTLIAQWNIKDFDAAYKEFMDKDIYDFDADRVLQADESDTKDNFAVVEDDVELIKDNETTNQVVSANKDTGVYVISNISDEVRSLKNGDKFMIVSDSNVDNNISVIVDSISCNGNTATITSAGGNIEDFYEYIQIDDEYAVSEENMQSEEDVAGGESNDGELHLGAVESNEIIFVGSGVQLEGTEGKTYSHKIVWPEGAKEEDSILHGQTDMGLSFTVVVEYDKVTFGKDYLRCDNIGNFSLSNDYTINFINASKEQKVKLFPVNLPIGTTGVSVVGDISLVFNCSGSIKGEFDSAYSKNVGFRFTTEEGFSSINDTVADNVSAKVNAKASVNVGVAPSIGLMLVSVLDGRLTGEIGAEASVTGEKDLLHPDSTHLCFLCFDGDIDLYAQLGVLLQAHLVGQDLTIYKEDNLIKATYPLGTFYCSFLNENGEAEFGWGECPYKNTDSDQIQNLSVITGKVVSKNSGLGVSGVNVSYSSSVTNELLTTQTSANGNFTLNVLGSIDEDSSLKFSKDGWVSFERPVNMSGDQKQIDMGTLEMTPTSSGELIIPGDSEDNTGKDDEKAFVGTIFGKVTDYNTRSKPLEGVTVYVYDYSNNNVIEQTETDSSGKFSINLNSPGSVRLEFHKDGYATYKEEEAFLSDNQKLVLINTALYPSELGAAIGEQCTFEINGKVVDSSTNNPIEGVTIICKIEGNNPFYATSGSDGNFTLKVQATNTGYPAKIYYQKDGYGTAYNGGTVKNYDMAWGNGQNQTYRILVGNEGIVSMYSK